MTIILEIRSVTIRHCAQCISFNVQSRCAASWRLCFRRTRGTFYAFHKSHSAMLALCLIWFFRVSFRGGTNTRAMRHFIRVDRYTLRVEWVDLKFKRNMRNALPLSSANSWCRYPRQRFERGKYVSRALKQKAAKAQIIYKHACIWIVGELWEQLRITSKHPFSGMFEVTLKIK